MVIGCTWLIGVVMERERNNWAVGSWVLKTDKDEQANTHSPKVKKLGQK